MTPSPTSPTSEGWTKNTWSVVDDGDDDISVCAFEGDPRDGIMSDVICTLESINPEEDGRLIAAAPTMAATLQAIVDESVFNQQRFAEDDDTDYFLRCFRAVKDRCRAALELARGGDHVR